MAEEMYKAVQANDPSALRHILETGGNPNEFFQDMTLISAKSILHMCCEKGRYECVKVLLEKGADLTIQDTWYQTPLMYCVITQYEEIAELLLQHDPGIVDIGDKYGRSALHIAVENGAVECIKVLLRYGADVDVLTSYGVTALIQVCGNKSLDQDTLLQIVKLLLDAGADCTIKCFRESRTALQTAMITMHVGVVELLLEARADPNTLDSGGRCPLTNLLWYHHCIDARGDIDDDLFLICIMLTQAGASSNISRYEHSNALCMATLYRCSGLVQFFLGNGGDQNIDFYCGITPLQIATRNKDVKTLKTLLNWHSDLYRKGRVVRGSLDYNTDVFRLAMDTGAFEIGIVLAEAGYDITKVTYLVDWSLKPPDALLNDQGMLEYFRERALIVQGLFKLTLLVIRKALRDNISEQAKELPLPKSLIRAVQMQDELT